MQEASRKTTLVLFILRFLRLLISVATLSISAHYFGVNIDRETWVLSLNFIVVLQLALWGPLNETFRAKFIFLKAKEGEEQALKRASSLIVFSALLMAIIVVVFEYYTAPLARLIAPAYGPENITKVCVMLRYLLWSTIIAQATQLLISILNTYHSFYTPEISSMISAVLNFMIIVLLSHYIGIYSFVLANYVSAFVLLIALLWQIRKRRIKLFHSKLSLSWQELKPFILFSIPFFLPYIAGQCNSLLEKSLSTLLEEGAVAIIDYSKKISEMIQTVLTGVLLSMMVPVLSSRFANGAMEQVEQEAKKYLGLIFLILAFFVPVLLVSGDPVTHILFDKGNITNTDLIKISTLIKLYALSLIAIFLYLILGLILLSVNKNKVYALYGMLAQLVMMLINIIGYREWGIYTFVVSLTFSHLFAAIILFYKLPFPKLGIAADIFKYGFLIVLTTVSVFLIKHFLYNPTNYYAAIAYNSFIVVLCGFVFAIFLKIEELKSLQIPFRHINKK